MKLYKDEEVIECSVEEYWQLKGVSKKSTKKEAPVKEPVAVKKKVVRAVIRGRRKRWTSTEDDTIKKEYRSAGARRLAKLFGRTSGAVMTRAWQIGATKRQGDKS